MFKLMGKKIIAILHSTFMIDIPLAMPLRKSMIKSQSVDESSPRNAGKSSRLSIENYFPYSSTKTYIVGAQKNCLNETVLLSTQNTCLNWWVRK